jgi:hypothetical protein
VRALPRGAKGGAVTLVELDDVERKLVLLALAELSVDRPGFDFALGELAEKIPPDGRELFEEFKRLTLKPPRPRR